MSNLAPQVRSQELLSELRKAAQNKSVNDFMLLRLEKEAKSLAGVDAYGASLLMGAIAALRFDYDESAHWHCNAIKLQPRNNIPYINYAVSLMVLYRFDEACEQYAKAWELDNSDKFILKLYIGSLIKSGRFHKAQEMFGLWGKLSPDEQHEAAPLVNKAVAVVDDLGLDENAIYAEISLASQLLFEKKIIHEHYLLAIYADDESSWINYSFVVSASNETVLDLEDELADRQAEKSSTSKESIHFVIRLRPDV